MSGGEDRVGPSLAEVLDAPRLLGGVQLGPPHVEERVVARDRVGDLGLVATVRPSGHGRRGWYWSYEVLAWEDGAWTRANEHGERWPRDPGAPRPDTPGWELLTGVTLGGGDIASHAVVGGVVGRPVATLAVVTSVERHRVPFDAETGIFTMLALTAAPADERFELTARGADGGVLDRMGYAPPSEDGELPPGAVVVATPGAHGISNAVYVLREVPRPE